MKLNSGVFTLFTAVALIIGSGIGNASFAQSKSTYVGTSGTVYSNYKGAGEVANHEESAEPDVYCYQCRAFHTHTDHMYYNNRENCHELGRGHCGHGEAVAHHSDCGDCKDYSHDLYDMDHQYDDCGGDYMVKYHGNKVKVKCAGCNAKWKYYYNDYHSNNHYVYDKDDRVIVSYQD